MIKSNSDVIAVAVLIAASAVFSAAQRLGVWDVFAGNRLVVQRMLSGPAVRIVSLVPAIPCLQD